MLRATFAFALMLSAVGLQTANGQTEPRPATGPLRVHPENPRYFTDGTKLAGGRARIIYLTGSHTWANLIDRGPSDPPPEFDFDGYLKFLQRHRHNFIRLWTRHVSWYHGYGQGELRAAPLAWARTGPGNALDGQPRFDLKHISVSYLNRLRQRVLAAGDHGIYVSVMLFGGTYECQGGWRGNPFHRENNINGLDGDPDQAGHGLGTHTLEIAAITAAQELYVRNVLETLQDLDNVLYEISNEGHVSSFEWQTHWVQFIQQYEKGRPKKHPVGMTALYLDSPQENEKLLRSSPAVWISPLINAKNVGDIPAADGAKVSFLDSDHWFVKEIYGQPAFGREWVWKAFCRGHQPILMEHLAPLSFVDPDYPLTMDDPGYTASRRAMDQTRRFAERIDLATMTPRNQLASTGFCLADPGKEYLVYQPAPKAAFSVQMENGVYELEWFDPISAATQGGREITVFARAHSFRGPFEADAVLWARRR